MSGQVRRVGWKEFANCLVERGSCCEVGVEGGVEVGQLVVNGLGFSARPLSRGRGR